MSDTKTGYVLFYRDVMNNEIFKNANPNAWKLFSYCVFKAHYRKHPRGQFTTTYSEIQDETNMSRATISKFLKFLKEQGAIDYRTDHQKTTIEVINYDKYQLKKYE